VRDVAVVGGFPDPDHDGVRDHAAEWAQITQVTGRLGGAQWMGLPLERGHDGIVPHHIRVGLLGRGLHRGQ
jgi:hypothetical protein